MDLCSMQEISVPITHDPGRLALVVRVDSTAREILDRLVAAAADSSIETGLTRFDSTNEESGVTGISISPSYFAADGVSIVAELTRRNQHEA